MILSKRRIKQQVQDWHIAGVFFTMIVGTFLHYTYALSGYNRIVGLFSPVNEDLNQHFKLLFVPFIFFTIVELFFYGKRIAHFFVIRLFSVIIGVVFIATAFYGYNWIIGRDILWADITIFILSILISYAISYVLLLNSEYLR